jgi:hypothetical protein
MDQLHCPRCSDIAQSMLHSCIAEHLLTHAALAKLYLESHRTDSYYPCPACAKGRSLSSKAARIECTTSSMLLKCGQSGSDQTVPVRSPGTVSVLISSTINNANISENSVKITTSACMIGAYHNVKRNLCIGHQEARTFLPHISVAHHYHLRVRHAPGDDNTRLGAKENSSKSQ